MTIAQSLGVAVMRLRSAPTSPPSVRASALLDAQVLLAEVVAVDRAWLLAHGGDELDPTLSEIYGVLVGERARGVPIAYLTHKAGFFGREFYVDERVLVPRPESEHLIEAALDDLRARIAAGRLRPRVADVGTGSGALALTLAAECANADVIASDVSEDALAVAERNAQALGLEARVRFVQGDLGAPLRQLGPFDVIVANLPYVPRDDVPAAPDPVSFEPRVAVDGGRSGLDLYRRLAVDLARLLAPGGAAFLEAAPPTIAGLAEVVERALPGAYVEVGEDYAGLERFVSVWPARNPEGEGSATGPAER